MNSLITEFSVQEEISISYPFSNCPRSNFKPSPNRDNSFQTPNTQPDNPCNICKAAGRNYKGHSVKNYWFILKFDKLEIAKLSKLMLMRSLLMLMWIHHLLSSMLNIPPLMSKRSNVIFLRISTHSIVIVKPTLFLTPLPLHHSYLIH